MRSLCAPVLLLLCLSAVRAQPAAPVEAPPRRPAVVPLVVGGTVGGAVVAFATVPLALVVPGGDAEPLLLVEAGYALGAAAGVVLTGRLLGADGSERRALAGAALGGALAMGATVGAIWVIQDEKSDALAAIPVAAAFTVLLPTALAVRGLRVVPAALAAATGGRDVGLALRLGL